MKYTTVYFDLDNTLLDFLATEHKAIYKLLTLHKLPCNDEIAARYSAINKGWWERFERGEIKKDEIYAGRFRSLLEALGENGDAEQMAKDYFGFLSEGHDLMDGAIEALEYVKGKGYTICATTNGVSFTQYKRIKESGLGKYFDYVFVSEDAGHQKPEREYFDYVMANSPEKDRSKIIVIGDSQSSDVLGGINAGLDTCWYNTTGEAPRFEPTYEIKHIREVMEIL